MADSSWTAKGKGLWLLLRPLPVLAWTGGAFILSVGLAYRAGLPLLWHQLGRAFLVASIVQGWLAHSLNDRTDWVSGTDQEADQFLSGGSGVIQQGLFDLPQLLGIAAASGMLIFVLVRRSVDLRLYFLLGVGCWGAVAYSAKPWRLAYVPLAGEWAAAFPAIVACGLALYQAAAGGITGLVLMASILHGLMAIAWLMQHHLPDWERDLQAAPPKYTTVAW